MGNYLLSCEVTVSALTMVKADSLERAIEIAKERPVVIGGIGTQADGGTEWVIEEADGSPENIHSAEFIEQ